MRLKPLGPSAESTTRARRLAFGAALALTTLGWVGPSLEAQGPDFDGDGFADLAVGAPLDDLGAEGTVGKMNVIYGTAGGLSPEDDQLWHQDIAGILGAAECCDQFGSALAWGDFDNDGFDDLAIGVPDEGLGAASGAGAVAVLYGNEFRGLGGFGNQLWHRDSPGVLGTAGSGDSFGEALAAGDFNGDGFDDLAVGVPFDDLTGRAGTILDAGSLSILHGSASGLTEAGDQLWSQNSQGVLGTAEEDDLFGSALVAVDFNDDGFDDLAIGAEREDLSGAPNAGAVNILRGSAAGLSSAGNQLWTQASAGIPDIPEFPDRFGSSLAGGDLNGDGFGDLAIGVPSEGDDQHGAVQVLYGGGTGLAAAGNQIWTQDTPGVLEQASSTENFGEAVAAGDVNADGFDDLTIGVPHEDQPGVPFPGGGAVHVLLGSAAGLTAAGNELWHQDLAGVLGVAESLDLFGWSVGVSDFNGDGFGDLAVGILDDDAGAVDDAGSVQVFYGTASGLSAAGDQIWHQNSPGIEDAAAAGDHFGEAVGRP